MMYFDWNVINSLNLNVVTPKIGIRGFIRRKKIWSFSNDILNVVTL
jgi:hypothetical protein